MQFTGPLTRPCGPPANLVHDLPSGLRWRPVSARDIPAIVALYADAAIGLYERLGFARAGRRARYEPAPPVRPPGPPRGRE